MAHRRSIFLPQIKKDDELYGLIYLTQWMYKNKYSRLICYFYLITGVGYLYLFMELAFTSQWKNIVSLDILIALHFIEVIITSVSILNERKTMMEINQFRVQYFWDSNFLNKREKRKFECFTNIAVYLHSLMWIFSFVITISPCFVSYRPDYIYDSYLTKFTVTLSICLYIFFGYYMAIAHVSFFTYNILHGYCQLNTLSAYLRNECLKYKKMNLNEKLRSYEYQSVIGGVLLRCIKQHKQLTNYGQKISGIYNKIMVFHFFTLILLYSTADYCIYYDRMGYEVTLFLSIAILNFILFSSFYLFVGDLFTNGYEVFYNELAEVQWYSLDWSNRRMYFMFLTFAQMVHEIEVWPNLPITKPLWTKSMNMIYSGFTLLISLQSQK